MVAPAPSPFAAAAPALPPAPGPRPGSAATADPHGRPVAGWPPPGASRVVALDARSRSGGWPPAPRAAARGAGCGGGGSDSETEAATTGASSSDCEAGGGASLGRPLTPRGRRPRAAAAVPLILSTEVATNLAYYSISINLVLYMTEALGKAPADAAAQAHLWTGVSYLTPLVGGAVADGALGRPLTILISVAVYTAGLAALTAQAFLLPPSTRTGAAAARDAAPVAAGGHALFTLAMVCVAVGTGGVKPNVSAAGADQYGRRGEPGAVKAKASFFHWCEREREKVGCVGWGRTAEGHGLRWPD